MSSICLPLCLWVVVLRSPQHMHSYREAVSPIRKGRMKGRRWQTLSPCCHFFNKKKAKFPFQRVYWCSIGWDTRSLALDPRRAASQGHLCSLRIFLAYSGLFSISPFPSALRVLLSPTLKCTPLCRQSIAPPVFPWSPGLPLF